MSAVIDFHNRVRHAIDSTKKIIAEKKEDPKYEKLPDNEFFMDDSCIKTFARTMKLNLFRGGSDAFESEYDTRNIGIDPEKVLDLKKNYGIFLAKHKDEALMSIFIFNPLRFEFSVLESLQYGKILLINQKVYDAVFNAKVNKIVVNTKTGDVALAEILNEAKKRGASDVYMSYEGGKLYLRFRINEIRHSMSEFEDDEAQRIKRTIFHKAKENDNALCFGKTIEVDNAEHRVQYFVTTRGNWRMTIRVHGDVATKISNITDAGYDEASALPIVKRLLRKQNGLVLITGPTGSGKTTTLYIAINMNKHKRESLTIENPVERNQGLVDQIDLSIYSNAKDKKAQIDGAEALRMAYRSKPDVIVFGEIREYETLELCIDGALSGHLVLSSYHANTAKESLVRMKAMGVDEYMITSTTRGIVCQRLVPRLCHKCKVPDQKTFKKGKGCDHCDESGYEDMVPVWDIAEFPSAKSWSIYDETTWKEYESFEKSARIQFEKGYIDRLWRDAVIEGEVPDMDEEEAEHVA